jgi:microcystin-dependent protein
MNEILKETNFDENFPQDDSYISDFPAGARKQNKALKDEQIVDAGKLQGLIPSNENGQIPINNGNENINLNAGMLNGKTSSDFAPKSHSHDVATQDSNGYMSNADKRKLDGIASGAEVNQNAFANVKVGSNTIQADAKQDTLELAAGTNISLVGDANNDKVTIAVTGKVASASQADSATNATQDSTGQTINTTYVKSVSASNATLTITKGNGSTSTATVNNVSRAEYSDRVGANAGYSNDTKGSALKGGISQSAIYSNNFPFLYGNLISVKNSGANQIALEWSGTTGAVGRVAVRSARDAGIDTWSAWRYLAYTESPAFSGTPTAPTPGVDTNNTQLATCGFVRNAIAKYAPMLDILKKVYPVGSIYMSTVSTNPATLFGFGTWEAMPAGRVLLAQGKSSWGTTYNAGSTGGEATHQLTVGELPSHNHSGSTNAAGEHTHPVKRATTGNSGSKPAITYDTYMPAMSIDTVPITNASGSHTHSITISATGSGQAHNNIQPYIATYMWKRTA